MEDQTLQAENEALIGTILNFTEIAAVVAATFYTKITAYNVPPSDAGAITAAFMSNYTASAAQMLGEHDDA